MYEDYEFSKQFMNNMTDDFVRYIEANHSHIKCLEVKVEYLEDRIASLEKQYEQLQQLFEMIHKENESLKAYIKSGEKIIKLEKDFTDDNVGCV